MLKFPVRKGFLLVILGAAGCAQQELATKNLAGTPGAVPMTPFEALDGVIDMDNLSALSLRTSLIDFFAATDLPASPEGWPVIATVELDGRVPDAPGCVPDPECDGDVTGDGVFDGTACVCPPPACRVDADGDGIFDDATGDGIPDGPPCATVHYTSDSSKWPTALTSLLTGLPPSIDSGIPNDAGIPLGGALPANIVGLLDPGLQVRAYLAGPPTVTSYTQRTYDANDNPVDLATPGGLWFPIELRFFDDAGTRRNATAVVHCGCTDADTPGWEEACQKVRDTAYALPDPFPKHVCQVADVIGATVGLQFRQIRLKLGLVPVAPVNGACPQGSRYLWAPSFPGLGGAVELGAGVCVDTVVAGHVELDQYCDVNVDICGPDVTPEQCLFALCPDPGAYCPYACPGVDSWVVANLDAVAGSGTEFACSLANCGLIVAGGAIPKIRPYLDDVAGASLNAQLREALAPYIEGPNVAFDAFASGYPLSLGEFTSDANAAATLIQASSAYHVATWFQSPFGPYPNGHSFPVTSIATLCPSPPCADGDARTLRFHFEINQDDDNIPDWDDPFPDCPYSLTDFDNDGIADACDPCVADPLNDEDGDGWCADLDNCPNAANPNQENCNLEYEIANGHAILGDACDPVPCPRLRKEEGPLVDVSPNGGFVCGTKVENLVHVTPLAWYDSDGTKHGLNNKQTRFRACVPQPTANPPILCDAPADFLDAAAVVASCAPGPLCGGFFIEKQEHSFHRISLVKLPPATPLPPGPQEQQFCNVQNYNDAPPLLDYTNDFDGPPSAGPTYRWCYEPDLLRMEQDGLLNTGDIPVGTTAVKAVFWANINTSQGDDEHGKDLGNDRITLFTEKAPECEGQAIEIEDPFFLWKTLPDPPPEVVVNPADIVGLAPGRTQVLARTDLGFSFLARDGLGAPAESRLGPWLEARLLDPTLHWILPVEPALISNQGAAFPMAFALSEDGSDLVDAAHSVNGQLLADADRGIVREELIGSPHADRFAAFASRYRRMVVVVGGYIPNTTEPTGEIWWVSLTGANRWSRVRTAFQPDLLPPEINARRA